MKSVQSSKSSITPRRNAPQKPVEKEEEKDEGGDDMRQSAVSFLDPVSIRWMNKRRKNVSNHQIANKVTPQRAQQIRDMFNGLDFDGGGEIDLQEFKQAVSYVAVHTKNSSWADPKKLNEMFVAMDTDGSGTVDFNEFMVAMTTDLSGGFSGTGKDLSRLQYAFFDFANLNRRQTIIDRIGNNEIFDSVRYKEFERLFTVEYFNTNNEEILSTDEELGKLSEDTKKDINALNKKFQAAKRAEIQRSREAYLALQAEARQQKTSSMPDIEQTLPKRARAEYYRRMSRFTLKKPSRGMNTASTPTLPKLTPAESKNLGVKEILTRNRSCVLSMPPPLSLRETWEEVEKARKEADEDSDSNDDN